MVMIKTLRLLSHDDYDDDDDKYDGDGGDHDVDGYRAQIAAGDTHPNGVRGSFSMTGILSSKLILPSGE